jgi:hypothetical protein
MTMNRTSLLKRIGAGAVLIAATVAGVATALPANEVTYWYYSDASMSRPVGMMIQFCDGGRYYEGQTTGYSRIVLSHSCKERL